jgi:hypothetical protein
LKTFFGVNIEDPIYEEQETQTLLAVGTAIHILISHLPKEIAIEFLRESAKKLEDKL